MKKLVAILLAACICLTFVACGQVEEEKQSAPQKNEEQTENTELYESPEDMPDPLSEPAPVPIDVPVPQAVEDGLIAKQENGKWGFADSSGQFVFSPIYDEARSFVGGYASVRIGDKWGIIDDEGAYVVECEYEDVARVVSEGFVAVKSDGKWGYFDINTRGIIIVCKFNEADPFAGSKARVVLEDGSEAYIARPY